MTKFVNYDKNILLYNGLISNAYYFKFAGLGSVPGTTHTVDFYFTGREH